MNTQSRISNWLLLLCCTATMSVMASAHSAASAINNDLAAYQSHWTLTTAMAPTAPVKPIAPASSDNANHDSQDEGGHDSDSETIVIHKHHHEHHHADNGDDNALVNIGHDSYLAKNQQSDDVVSVLGSSTSEGQVANSVVSVLGNTRVTGPVGDSAVAVLGSVYVDSAIGGDVVAVLGNVELGPNANVAGDLVAVGGAIKRDPAAIVSGESHSVSIGGSWNVISSLDPWIKHCMFLARPLAFVQGIGWAWTLAVVALGIYVLIALLFGGVVERCSQTLEERPGASLLTAVLAVVATPMVFVILFVTVIGVLAVPFLWIALILTQIFGKLVMLAWIGRRFTRVAPRGIGSHPAIAVLIGGLIVMLLYTVPVFGFLLFNLLAFVGFGVVVYTLLLEMQGRRAARAGAAELNPGPGVAAAAGIAPAAADEQAPGASAAPVGAKSTRVPAGAALALPRAGFWIRMAALLFDAILVGVVIHLLLDSSRLFLVGLATYGAIMWKLRGTTVGGIIFNLQVVQHDGREMEWSTAVVRALSSFLSLIALGLGFIWIAVDSEKRAWHDKIAGTIVVRVP